jgi:AcrR family transcriptional regulator
MPAAPAPATRRRVAGADRRRQLLTLAEQLVSDHGVAALTMERLAELAGISKPVVYAHFANRDHVLIALLEGHWTSIDERVARRMTRATDFESRLRIATAAYFDVISERGPLVALVLGETGLGPAAEAARDERRRQITALWSADVQATFGIPRAQADAACTLLRASLEQAVRHHFHRRTRRRLLEETYVTIVLSTLEALACYAT